MSTQPPESAAAETTGTRQLSTAELEAKIAALESVLTRFQQREESRQSLGSRLRRAAPVALAGGAGIYAATPSGQGTMQDIGDAVNASTAWAERTIEAGQRRLDEFGDWAQSTGSDFVDWAHRTGVDIAHKADAAWQATSGFVTEQWHNFTGIADHAATAVQHWGSGFGDMAQSTPSQLAVTAAVVAVAANPRARQAAVDATKATSRWIADKTGITAAASGIKNLYDKIRQRPDLQASVGTNPQEQNLVVNEAANKVTGGTAVLPDTSAVKAAMTGVTQAGQSAETGVATSGPDNAAEAGQGQAASKPETKAQRAARQSGGTGIS